MSAWFLLIILGHVACLFLGAIIGMWIVDCVRRKDDDE